MTDIHSCSYYCDRPECIKAQRDELRERLAKPDAYGYASRLAVAIWEQHYKDVAPQWKPLDDLMGVLTQIDNMTAGLTRLAQPERERDDDRIAALRTLDYCHGLKAGWNFCVADDDAGFERAMDATSEAVRILKTQPAQQPLTDEQIEPMFRAREKLESAGEKDAWYWYAWGVSDGEAAHGIKGEA